MMARKAAFHNLGCKVNLYEAEAMMQALEGAGYEIVPFAPGADVYVINTCTVTNIADRKSRQMLHRAKKMNQDAVVVAVGCYVQTGHEELEKDPAVDIVVGSHEKASLAERIERFYETGTASPALIDDGRDRWYEPLSINAGGDRARVFLKVQDGCDLFCTYCAVPYARGRVRSRPFGDVLGEAERLVSSGAGEIVLTGIHICSYGKDLGGEDLTELVMAVHDTPGLRRLRLSSLEPSFITEDVVEKWSRLPGLCHHFHLSLQSGCDATLSRMGRRYTTSEYAEKIRMLRDAFGSPALTTDIITGFPGETDGEFSETMEFVDGLDLFDLHVFPYSRREGTKAADMPGQLTERVKKERGNMMRVMQRAHRDAYLEKFVGSRVEVLLEERVSRGGETFFAGHGREYQRVLCGPGQGTEGETVTVVPRRAEDGVLLA